jgi:hypothetical protein
MAEKKTFNNDIESKGNASAVNVSASGIASGNSVSSTTSVTGVTITASGVLSGNSINSTTSIDGVTITASGVLSGNSISSTTSIGGVTITASGVLSGNSISSTNDISSGNDVNVTRKTNQTPLNADPTPLVAGDRWQSDGTARAVGEWYYDGTSIVGPLGTGGGGPPAPSAAGFGNWIGGDDGGSAFGTSVNENQLVDFADGSITVESGAALFPIIAKVRSHSRGMQSATSGYTAGMNEELTQIRKYNMGLKTWSSVTPPLNISQTGTTSANNDSIGYLFYNGTTDKVDTSDDSVTALATSLSDFRYGTASSNAARTFAYMFSGTGAAIRSWDFSDDSVRTNPANGPQWASLSGGFYSATHVYNIGGKKNTVFNGAEANTTSDGVKLDISDDSSAASVLLTVARSRMCVVQNGDGFAWLANGTDTAGSQVVQMIKIDTSDDSKSTETSLTGRIRMSTFENQVEV